MSINERLEFTLEHKTDPLLKKKRQRLTLYTGALLLALSILGVLFLSSGVVLLLTVFALFPAGLLTVYLSLRPYALEGMMIVIVGFVVGIALFPSLLEHKIGESLVDELHVQEVEHQEQGSAFVYAGEECQLVEYELHYGMGDLVHSITPLSNCDESNK